MRNKPRISQLIWRYRPALVLIFLAAVLNGCGTSESESEKGTASVTITFDGRPVTEGTVNLIVIGTSQSANGELNEAGQVMLEDVETGAYVVSVLPPPPPDAVAGEPPAARQEYKEIPLRFRSETTSPLKAEVNAGESEFKFDLAKQQ